MICMNHYIIFGYILQCNGEYLHLALKDIKSRHPDRTSARELFSVAKKKN